MIPVLHNTHWPMGFTSTLTNLRLATCETPKLYNGLGRDVEYTLNISMAFWSSGVARMKATSG